MTNPAAGVPAVRRTIGTAEYRRSVLLQTLFTNFSPNNNQNLTVLFIYKRKYFFKGDLDEFDQEENGADGGYRRSVRRHNCDWMFYGQRG
jgi:hypothetical protein